MYDMIISWIATPLGFLMQFCHSLLSDYGLVISLFTLITKIIILPVGIWVHMNSIKIVKIQPAINKLKAKFYGDKERIGEEQSKMYKEQKYNPFASLIPLAIQIVLLLGVVAVIYHPFTYIFKTPDTVINDITQTAAVVIGEDFDLESNSVEINSIYAIKNNPEAFAEIAATEEGALAIKNAQAFDLDFFGFDLSATPSQVISQNWIYVLAPIIAGFSSWFLCFIQNKINVLQAEQGKGNKWGTMAFSVGLSLYLGFFVPAGIALYWVVSNIIAVLQLLLLNAIISPKKFVDYEALEESRRELAAIEALDGDKKKGLFHRDENAKREKKDYKRFFSIANKHLVIYSEKSGFYKYFENFIEALLKNTSITIHYVTNDPNDAIFKKAETEPRIKPYYIGPKKIITFMMRMDADIVLMTTPDLEKYYIKRSYVRKDIEYIYTFHGPTSTTMCVREGAYDYFDTIFCVGQHQINEIQATEELYNLKKKTLVPVGFGVIDNLCKMYDEMEKVQKDKKQILLAPSWQEDNILEYCLDELMEGLLHKGNKVILRPHPEYIKRFPAKMDAIVKKYEGCDGEDFIIEMDFSSNRTIWESDLIITDWSGIAYEFSYATKKPSMFINTPMKVLNPNYEKIPFVPTEISWKDEVGISIDTDKLNTVPEVVSELLSNPEKYEKQISEALERNIFNVGESGLAGAKYIYNQIVKRQQEKTTNKTEKKK
ncbi:MAG: membrane protein insertase YidC [Clostridia bacterium]|nr:membrane protein insertase YidC [Clostridia bacterium]